MAKLLILLVLLLTGNPVESQPVCVEFTIVMPTAIIVHPTTEEVLQAMIYVESGDKGSYVPNPNEPAVGILQIWPIMVQEVNRILGYEKYTLDDRYNDRKSIEMFWVYQNYWNPNLDLGKMARIWNGGPTGYKKASTLPYLTLVKERLAKS